MRRYEETSANTTSQNGRAMPGWLKTAPNATKTR